ncbi:MAG TPA: site-2 protease family protein [Anaerolineaceae bacterium]|nr:site-2 protease family protein [Anaerolineaceae bacterium]
MRWSFKLFKIKGIDVKIHTLFILILVWAAYRWSVTTGDGLQGALFGVVATLLLFVAVFLHELGHSLQAMKYKVKVKDITLMPLGGVAQMEELPKNPKQELKIALAGPLVNFAIAAILVVIGMILQTRSIISLNELVTSLGQTNWAGMLAYLTMANLLLGLFNLLPAFPMDGGRILRSLLAMRMDHTRATRIAAVIGQGLAFLMGLIGFMNGQFTLILIAIFVWMGASQESRGVVVQDTLRDIKVRRAMVRSPHSLKVNDSLSKAVELTLTSAQSDFPVVEWSTQKVVGILGEAELLNGLKKLGEAAAVREVMRTDFPATHLDDALYVTIEKMAKAKIKAVPVVDDDQNLIGMISSNDVNEAYRLLTVNPQFVSEPQS